MTGFQLLTELFCCLPLFLEVRIDLTSVGKIIGDHAIDLS